MRLARARLCGTAAGYGVTFPFRHPAGQSSHPLTSSGLDEHLENQCTRGVEDARYKDPAITGRRDFEAAGIPHGDLLQCFLCLCFLSFFFFFFNSPSRSSSRVKDEPQNWRYPTNH